MALVGELLLNNGFLPQLAELYDKKKGFFTKRNGAFFSLFWFLFFLFIVTPFWAIVDVEELAGISAILGIFGGLIILIASLVLLKTPSKTPPYIAEMIAQNRPASLHGPAQTHALPPQQTQPVQDYAAPQGSWRTPDTGEFAVPGSVTETTTKLLKKNE